MNAVHGPRPELAAIRQKQQATWASGDDAVIGTTLQIVGEMLAEAADIRAGEQVLDVAAGNGNATLAAARRFARVVSTDYVPSLLEKGQQRAAAEGLDVQFRIADVEALPYEDGRFDVVVSTFGAMFAPDPVRTADEMLRVTRSGGRIALANWTPEGFVGRLLELIGAHRPPPAGLAPPPLWGREARLRELFGAGASAIRCARRHFKFRYRSAAHFVRVFRDCDGPTHKAFAALPGARGEALERDLLALLAGFDRGGGASLVVPAEYLEVVIDRR